MIQIQNSIDELIKRVKANDELCECTFVKGFMGNEHSNPQTKYMIAVSTPDIDTGDSFVGNNVSENLKGRLYEVNVRLRVYAPKNAGGDGLSKIVNLLSSALKDSDILNVIVKLEQSPIAFDSNASTVYRDVKVQMSFCLCEEVTR